MADVPWIGTEVGKEENGQPPSRPPPEVKGAQGECTCTNRGVGKEKCAVGLVTGNISRHDKKGGGV